MTKLKELSKETTNYWSNYVGEIESKVPGLTKEQILSEYKDVFTGLGRLKVEPIKFISKRVPDPTGDPAGECQLP